VSGVSGKNINGSSSLTIGSWSSSAYTFLNGDMDDIRIYSEALSAAAVDSISGVAPDPAPEAEPQAPVAHWSLDEGNGSTTEDISINDNYGYLINNPLWTAGISGYALYFDGINDRLDCGNDLTLDMGDNNVTISTWLMMDAVQEEYATIIGKGGNSDTEEGYWMFVNNGTLKFYLSDGSSSIIATADPIILTDNNPHHVAVTIDRDSVLIFYLDGLPVGTTDVSAYSGAVISSSNSLTIGSYQDDDSTFFNGYLDEIQLFNRTLPETEIFELATAFDSDATVSQPPDSDHKNSMLDSVEKTSISAYPNPFDADIWLDFDIHADENVTITLYNINGELINVLADKTFAKGPQTIKWDGNDSHGNVVARGIYVVKIIMTDRTENLVIVKMR
jgi:hypothetical protein